MEQTATQPVTAQPLPSTSSASNGKPWIKWVITFVAVALLSSGATYIVLTQQKFVCTLQDAETPRGDHATKEQVEKYSKCRPVTLFLSEKATESQITQLIEELRKTKGVYEVKYTSREKAVEDYKEMNKNEPLLIEMMPKGNFLPASIDVYVYNPDLRGDVVRLAKSKDFVQGLVPSSF